MFKNLIVYALDADWCDGIANTAADLLAEKLAAHPLLPVNQASMSSSGWTPFAAFGGPLYSIGKGNFLLSLGHETRMLPASVINREWKARAAALKDQQGFAPGRKQLRDLKDLVIDELRPKAFIKSTTTMALLNLADHLLIVDTPSAKLAEDLGTVLRADLGDLPGIPFDTKQTPSAAMTGWVATKSAPPFFVVEGSCDLIADNPSKSEVKVARCDLADPAILKMIGDGKIVSKLSLCWRERVSFVLTDKGIIKRLRFLADTDADEGKNGADQHAEDVFAASALIFSSEVSLLLADLTAALGGAK
ncbi:recombination-associated protein RdgC [Nevskia ramosa]|uniref:recombination-associated protein RdgC n=1 Tax=Nevskia ramosa TaxID=64002 RepID=UPI003D13EDD9